jgi:hypothetical protein
MKLDTTAYIELNSYNSYSELITNERRPFKCRVLDYRKGSTEDPTFTKYTDPVLAPYLQLSTYDLEDDKLTIKMYDKRFTITSIGHPGMSRSHPKYYEIQLTEVIYND